MSKLVISVIRLVDLTVAAIVGILDLLGWRCTGQ